MTTAPLAILVAGPSSGFGRVISDELAVRGHTADGVNAVSEELQRSVLDGLGLREQLTFAGHQVTTAEA